MKKLLVLLALCMVFTLVLVACQEKPGTEETTTTGATTEAPTTGATTEAPTTEAPTTEAPTTEAPTTEAPTTEAPTTEAPTTEAPTTEAPTTEAPTTEAPTTEAPTTEPVTTEPVTQKPVDPVYTHVSFDECDMWIGETNVGNFFTPGQSNTWDKIANVEDYNVEFIRIWGWVGFYNETIGEFGYQIDDNDPVYDAAFTWETGDDVKNAAAAGGAKSASRFQVMVPVRELSGEHTIKFLIKDAVGTVETYVEFTMNKAVDPNAPVAFIPAADMASSIPGSPGVNGAVMSADGTYVTIDTVNQGDPYYQLPMLNQKGTVASFVAIKYRSTSTFVRSEAFVGSGAGPSGAGDNITFNLTCDGKWHLAIVDLSQASAVVDNVINYLRWDPFAGAADATIDMAYIALFNSAEAAQIYDAKFADTYVDTLNVPQDVWGVTGHKAGIVPSEGDDLSGMIAAGGVESGALLHQGYIALGELDLAQFSKVVIYYGLDGSDVTIGHYNNNAANRIMLTSADQAMTNSPTEDVILAGSTYTELGWAVKAIEIDLTGVDYNGPVFVTYDTLPGTFMLISSVEFIYDNTPVEDEPEQPVEDPYYALSMDQAKEGATYYFTGAMDGYYLATSTNPAEAVKVYIETVEEGVYRQYFYDAEGVKTYIEIYDRGNNKAGVQLVTEPTCVFVFNADADTYVVDLGETGIFWMGTYNDYNTFGASSISYITGDNAANVGVTQYPVYWAEYPTIPEDTQPEEPAVFEGNWHASVDSFMYCVNGDFSDVVDFTQANTNSTIGTTITSAAGTLPAVTANYIYLANGWLAVDGYSLENWVCNIYAADGTLLNTVALNLREAEEGVLVHVANNMGYAGVPNRIGANDGEVLYLGEYAGQTVTVVYAVDAVDTDYTIELIKIDVTVPEAAAEEEPVESYNVPQDQWTVSGHCPQIVGATGHGNSPMVAAGGVESGALLHQGAIAVGEVDLSKYSKAVIYYGVDNSEVTWNAYNANPQNRIILTSADTHLTNSPSDDIVIASTVYEPCGWAVVAIEIDLTGIDYAGPVFVTYDTLPGTFMLFSSVEFVA